MTDLVPANALPQIRQQNPSELYITPFLGTVYYGVNLANRTLSQAARRIVGIRSNPRLWVRFPWDGQLHAARVGLEANV